MKMMSLPAVWTLMTVAIAGAIASDAAQAGSAFDGDDDQSLKRQHRRFSIGAGHAQHVFGEV